jgi:hypothetical protein
MTHSTAQTVDRFPGDVTAQGVALAYQRFVWRQLYVALHVAGFSQRYRDLSGSNLGHGLQLFSTFRSGVHIPVGESGFFIEPSLAMTWWPINTGLPPGFQQKEDQWPSIAFEPGLHVGFVF